MKSSAPCLTVLFLMIVIVNVIVKCRAEPLIKLTDFDDYKPILQQTVDFKHKLRIIEAVWGEIRIDYGNDLKKIADLYQQLDHTIEVYLKMQLELQAAEELRQKLRLHLVGKHAELFATSWGSKSTAYMPNQALQSYLGSLAQTFDSSILSQIFKRAIDICYDTIEPRYLAAHIRQTFVGNDVNSYEASLDVLIYLYWKFAAAGDASDAFLYEIAYYLHKLKSHYYFRHLNGRLMKRFEKVVNDLPATLRQLFLQSEFCLLNKQYGEFLYTTNAIDIDEQRRYVFTWGTPNVVDVNGVWLVNITEVGGNDLRLKFAFKSKQQNIYMRLEPSVKDYKDLIVAWRDGTALMGSDWTINFRNDYLVIENSKKLMCATDKLFDGRRFVFGHYNTQYNPSTESCQWTATICPKQSEKA